MVPGTTETKNFLFFGIPDHHDEICRMLMLCWHHLKIRKKNIDYDNTTTVILIVAFMLYFFPFCETINWLRKFYSILKVRKKIIWALCLCLCMCLYLYLSVLYYKHSKSFIQSLNYSIQNEKLHNRLIITLYVSNLFSQ